MTQVRNDVPLVGLPTRICSKCGANKPMSAFSLLRGKHSEERKKICVSCEGRTKKARKLYDMEMGEMDKLLSLPCCVCRNKSDKIKLDENKTPIAVLCSKCFAYQSNEPNTLLAAYNHAVMERDFPCFLKWRMSLARTLKPTPLLDLMENAES